MNAPVVVTHPSPVTLKLNGKAFRCERCDGTDFVKQLTRPIEALQYACMRCSNVAVFIWNDHIDELLPPRNDWQTPGGSVIAPEEDGLFTTLHEEYGFNLDVAASAKNTKCPVYFDGLTPETDALVRDWHDVVPVVNGSAHTRAFGNPPYKPKGEIEKWLKKALEQVASRRVFSVWLIPMSSSVGWFNDLVIPFAEWQTFDGRIPFIDPLATADSERTSPKQDNLLVIYDPRSTIIGHTAVRSAKTGKRLWTRPDIVLQRNHE